MKLLNKLFFPKNENSKIQCPRCGFDLVSTFKFCPNCGVNVELFLGSLKAENDSSIEDELKEILDVQGDDDSNNSDAVSDSIEKHSDGLAGIHDTGILNKAEFDDLDIEISNYMSTLKDGRNNTETKTDHSYNLSEEISNIDEFGLLDSNVKTNNNPVNAFGNSISEEDERKICMILQSIFEENCCDIVTLEKLFGRLLALDEQLVSKYNLSINNFAEFMNQNFAYYVTRDFISNHEILTLEDTIYNEFRNKDLINKQMISSFFEKIGFKNNQSYNRYFKKFLLNGFLRIGEDLIIRNTNFIISASDLDKIEKTINFSLNNREYVGISDEDKIYFFLPKIYFKWNHYLIEEILKKYFSNKYEIFINNGKTFLRRK